MQPNRSQLVNALRDTAQSASNMVAENLSVPIDAIAWALRKAGVPVNKPMFGSDWMNEQGVTPKVEQSGAKVIGDTIGMLSPLGFTKQGAKALIDAGSAVKNMPVGMSIQDVSPEIFEKGKYISAKTPYGEVGGNIGDSAPFSQKPFLKIHHAELDENMRGKGIGKKMYQKLIDDAHARGLDVFSDYTVETPAVNIYDSLKRSGYDVVNNVAGTMDGGVYGPGANSPAFKVLPRVK